MRSISVRRLPQRLALAWAVLLTGPAMAGPVTGDQAAGEAPAVGAAPDRATQPAVSTGHRNLDMLLEIQAQSAAGKATGAASSARSAGRPLNVPTPNTNLSGGVLAEAGKAAPAPAPAPAVSGLWNDLGGLSSRKTSAEPGQRVRVDWGGQGPSGGAVSSEPQETDAQRPASRWVDEPEFMRSLREMVLALREHRWSVLSGMLLMGLVLGGVKLYMRRR